MDSKVISVESRKKKEVYNKQLGVIFNGEDNLYPVLVENLIKASPTTKQCVEIYESFIGGSGFVAEMMEEPTENLLESRSPEDLLFEITPDLAEEQGVFIHISFNAAFEKTEHNVIPYDFCRVGKKDDKNYSGKIILNPDGWDRLADKKKIKVYDTYNPRKEVIQAQVERDGGWDNYKGQILYFKLNNLKGTYSESLVEGCYMFSDTEANLGLHYNRMVRKGFKDAWILRHKKFESSTKQSSFETNVKTVYGNENAGGILMVEDDFNSDAGEESKFKFDFLKDETKADKYKHFEESSANYIRKPFKIPTQLLDFVQGKLGNSSGDDLRAAESLYNKTTSKDRKKIERLFSELYRNYHININPSGDWSIGLYSLMEDGTIEEDDTTTSNNEE
ncbi:hypothetical protein [Mesonia sp. K4-1]|uniref:hypothetical protein n=1 Tax=Mesonia sp. K4-1 TaxID=2602760 RepID=UPI0011C869C7|nr:hypothetical protein [Mesonia sp. K4-1]TXK78684.1 hypothetical protein FT986_02505 [Mesonia sp. K4-1]